MQSKTFKQILADFFIGKEKTVTTDLLHARATITTKDGEEYTITRRGTHELFDLRRHYTYTYTGEEKLKSYLSRKSPVWVSDANEVILVHRVVKVKLDVTSDIVTYTYR